MKKAESNLTALAPFFILFPPLMWPAAVYLWLQHFDAVRTIVKNQQAYLDKLQHPK